MKVQRLVWYPKRAISDKEFTKLADQCDRIKDKKARELIYELLCVVYDLDQRVIELRDQIGEKTVKK